jgi:hypothetical protein
MGMLTAATHAATATLHMDGVVKRVSDQEAINRPNIDWQGQIRRGILRGLRNISETPENKGMRFLL